jgi:hypothetical protein
MGVFALRRSDFSVKLLQRCSELHQKTLSFNPRFGDDDVITTVYADKDLKSSFLRLPQQSFPVGNLVNLFLPFSPLRGLRPSRPFVFHSNFVVGVRKKYLLLKLIYDDRKFSKNIQLIQAYLYVFLEILIRKFRLLATKTIRVDRGK